ncbi:MAG: GxxExxY protein [Bacteroidetes bacterium]|nr:GxxExxY protein [Bacteroidota bacterium]
MNEPSDVYGLSNLIYKDEAYDIISCCFEVHKTLGKGFLEGVYKDALAHEFKLKNIAFKREQKFEVLYKDIVLPHYYCSDFIVYDKIVLEIKAQSDVIDQHYKQVINYLAVSKMKLGLLVNFGESSLKFKRIVL